MKIKINGEVIEQVKNLYIPEENSFRVDIELPADTLQIEYTLDGNRWFWGTIKKMKDGSVYMY